MWFLDKNGNYDEAMTLREFVLWWALIPFILLLTGLIHKIIPCILIFLFGYEYMQWLMRERKKLLNPKKNDN